MPTEIVLWSFTSSKGNRQARAIMLVRKKTRAQLFNLSPYSHAEQAWAGGEDVCVGGAGTLRRQEKSFASSFRITYFSKGPSAKQMQTNKQDVEEFRFLAAWMTQQTCLTELCCIPFLLLCRCYFFSWSKHVSFHRFSFLRFSSSCPFFCRVERNIIIVDLFPIFGVVDDNIVVHTVREYTHICILITFPTIPEVRLRVCS